MAAQNKRNYPFITLAAGFLKSLSYSLTEWIFLLAVISALRKEGAGRVSLSEV